MSDKSSKKQSGAPVYFGGMNFKEFRKSGRVGLWMNDLAWAGRIITRIPYWWRRLSQITLLTMTLCMLSLATLWASVIFRPPVLLLGVYPDGRVICMPRVLNREGGMVERHQSYNSKCSSLFKKAGLVWILDASRKNNGQMPSTEPSSEVEDILPTMRTATTGIDYIEKQMIMRLEGRQRSDVQTLQGVVSESAEETPSPSGVDPAPSYLQ